MALFIVPYIGSLTMISSSCIFLSNFDPLYETNTPPPPDMHVLHLVLAQCKLKVIGATSWEPYN